MPIIVSPARFDWVDDESRVAINMPSCEWITRGPKNSLTDIAGVRVGHVTLISGDGPLVPGHGPVRTGVTGIIPCEDIYKHKLAAGAHVINGFGKMTGLPQVHELGRLETPILLTNTLSVWQAADGMVDYLLARHPDIGISGPTCNPVVGECNDSFLNDIRGRHVRAAHARQALDGATDAAVLEGSVGAGTGMICYGFKGGIGSASRVGHSPALAGRVTIAALVLANFGRQADLRVYGCPVGRYVRASSPRSREKARGRGESSVNGSPGGSGGSVIVILGTDAPLTSGQLTRVARRAAAGLARTGSTYSHGSGDFALAFSTARTYPPYLADEGELLNPLFAAAADVTEEGVIRALLAGTAMTGRNGHRVEPLTQADLRRAWEAWRKAPDEWLPAY